MALTGTTLAAALTATGNRARITAAGTVAAGHFVKLSDELAKVMAVNGTLVDLQRGVRGTVAKAHGILCPFVYGTAADFAATNTGPTQVAPGFYTYGAAGAIAILPGTHMLLTGAGTAFTIAEPSIAENGMTLTIISGDTIAYTVTSTAGFHSDASTADVATFAQEIGNSMTFTAINGEWMETVLQGVTLG